MTDLDAITALLAAATPGPWQASPGDRDDYADEFELPYEDAPQPMWLQGPAFIEWGDANWFTESDAALIVAAVNALPSLIEAARREAGLRQLLDVDLVALHHIERLTRGDGGKDPQGRRRWGDIDAAHGIAQEAIDGHASAGTATGDAVGEREP